MNQFKETVLHELQHVKLAEEKKKRIAQKAKAKSKHRSSSQQQYRIVLATFTLLAIGFSVLMSQKTEQRARHSQGAALQQETERWSLWTLLELDWIKGLLLISIFVSVALIIKRILHKKGYGLPVCVECGEIWSAKQVRKLYWKNGQMECPHCSKKQYRTKKSVQLSGLLNLPITFIVFLNLAFDHFLIGFIFFIASSVIYHYLLLPDIVKLQEEDPSNEPLW
ncbi:TIGR04104 family putative zinc finger protein [Lysinibacillus sp. NPDC093197]|uniref:TIGR04104 family putative zinc finger protein n=1 Tax=Lysinibacillus sp. NPDC093197 TaxID=3364132 RepID=UPI0037FA66C8